MKKQLLHLLPLGLIIASQACTPSPVAEFETSPATEASPVEIQ